MRKKRQMQKAKPRAKPLSLYPLSFEQVVEVLVHTPPLKNPEKKTRKPKEK